MVDQPSKSLSAARLCTRFGRNFLIFHISHPCKMLKDMVKAFNHLNLSEIHFAKLNLRKIYMENMHSHELMVWGRNDVVHFIRIKIESIPQ